VVAGGSEVAPLVPAAVRGVDKVVCHGRQAFASGELDRAGGSVGEDLGSDPFALRRGGGAGPCGRARGRRLAARAVAVPSVAWCERCAAGGATSEDPSGHRGSSRATSRLRRFRSGRRGRSDGAKGSEPRRTDVVLGGLERQGCQERQGRQGSSRNRVPSQYGSIWFPILEPAERLSADRMYATSAPAPPSSLAAGGYSSRSCESV